MLVNKTNYRAIAAWLHSNPGYITKASSFNQLATMLNARIKDGAIPNVSQQIKLQAATLSTIIYALEGVKDSMEDNTPIIGYRLTLKDPFGNTTYLTIKDDSVHLKSSSCSHSLSNLQYKGDVHFELLELFHQRDYDGIDRLINTGTTKTVMDTKRLTH